MKKYVLTLKGLLSGVLEEKECVKVLDAIELHLRRNYSKGGNPCIILDLEKNEFIFETVKYYESRS